MLRFSLVAVMALALVVPGRAQMVLPATSATPGLLCRSAVAAAERQNGIPAQLLAAISRVESGRRDPGTGAVHPWPWAVNAEGEGFLYDSKAEAVAAVRAMQARGIRSIDVGCGQINLMYHPDAFPSLEAAFDPQTNATYAGHFLKELFAQTGDWNKAVAMYHSATPEIGADYQQKVLAVWPEEQRNAGLVGPSAMPQGAPTWSLAAATTGSLGFTRILRTQPAGIAQAARVIMLPTINGMAPPGRGLDAYRAAPIGLAYQPPPRGIGG